MGTEIKTDVLNPSDETKAAVNYLSEPGDVSGALWAVPVTVGAFAFADIETKLLLPGDDLPIIDESSSSHTFSNSGVTIDTTNKKFGAGSLAFVSSASADSAASADWDLGTLWTVDLWIRPTSSGSFQKFLGTQFSGTYWELLITNTGRIGWEQSGAGFLFGTNPLTLSVFQHVALTYDGSDMRVWIDGVLDSTTAYVTTFNSGGNSLRLGKSGTGSEPFTGQVDELRISKGILRWTAPFTPPTAPYEEPGYKVDVSEVTSPTLTNKMYGRNSSNEPIEITAANSRKNIIYDLGSTSGGASIDYDVNPATLYTATATAAITGWTFSNFPTDFPFKLHVTGDFDITYGTDGSGETANQDGLKVFNVEYDGSNYQMTWENQTEAGMTNPMTTAADIIVGGASGVPARLAKGTGLQVLRMNAGATAQEWADPAAGAGKLLVEDSGYGLDNGSTGRGTVGTDAVSLEYSTTGSGYGAVSQNTTVGGGTHNKASAGAATVSGGGLNEAAGEASTIGGGTQNIVNALGDQATISGGKQNTTEGTGCVISGGLSNSTANAKSYCFIGGGSFNEANNSYCVVNGGSFNEASAFFSTIIGGSYGFASHYGEVAVASGRFSVAGDCQRGNVQARIATSSTSEIELFLDGLSLRFTLLDGDSYTCEITVLGKQADGSCGTAKYRALIKKEGATTSLTGSVQTLETWFGDAGINTPTFAITADDTNEALKITVTPANATATRWTALLEYVKINY